MKRTPGCVVPSHHVTNFTVHGTQQFPLTTYQYHFVAVPLAVPLLPGHLTMHPSPWTLLLIAGLFEVGWAIGLKYSHGFTRLTPSVLTVVAMAISLFLLGKALRDIPVGTGYAVWTGVGAVGTAILGIVLLNEPRDLARLGCIALIVLGIAGLKLTAPA